MEQKGQFQEDQRPLVLVADGDPYMRELAGRFLEEAGYRVVKAKDGYEALDTARKTPPLAILADMLLPRLDGLALCRLIKGDPATKDVVTVIVFSVLSAQQRAKAAGADAFMLKPLEKRRLLKTLETVTGKEATAND